MRLGTAEEGQEGPLSSGATFLGPRDAGWSCGGFFHVSLVPSYYFNLCGSWNTCRYPSFAKYLFSSRQLQVKKREVQIHPVSLSHVFWPRPPFYRLLSCTKCQTCAVISKTHACPQRVLPLPDCCPLTSHACSHCCPHNPCETHVYGGKEKYKSKVQGPHGQERLDSEARHDKPQAGILLVASSMAGGCFFSLFIYLFFYSLGPAGGLSLSRAESGRPPARGCTSIHPISHRANSYFSNLLPILKGCSKENRK